MLLPPCSCTCALLRPAAFSSCQPAASLELLLLLPPSSASSTKPAEHLGAPRAGFAHRRLPCACALGITASQGQCPLLLQALEMLCGAAWHSVNDCCCFFSPAADDQAPCQAAGLWPRRGAGHQGARLLPLHRLGQAGAQRDSASLQAKGCKCDCVTCAPPLPLSRTLFLSCTVSHSRWWVHTHTSICAGAAHLTRSVEVSLIYPFRRSHICRFGTRQTTVVKESLAVPPGCFVSL